ncbi:bacillithiol biosynthesis cysteine-adding enzyme BshC [Rhodohalobacter sp. 614A]|uniref:bacillithiol biosynthesis cysteine-adding enzyme BshC n=1 Tax=Rhodohalobacter sp. 614A TaxID=2908649 RepID=UPI001F1F2DAD
MNLSQISFLDLPFNKLFQDYISNFQKLNSFYEVNPNSDEEIESALQAFNFQGDRNKTVELLKKFNKQFGAGKKTITSIEKLAEENAIAVVTGQQLTMLGGPLFTVYKILTAIHFAQKWQEQYNIPAVPVFWLADEDHDYDEIAGLGFPWKDDYKSVQLDKGSEVGQRVSEIELDTNFATFKKQVIESQYDTDFTDPLWRILDKCYSEGETIGMAFGKLILSLFEEYGVVLAGTAHTEIKEHLVSTMIQSVEKVEEQFQALKNQTDKLVSNGYHGQVHLQPSNLFWIDDDKKRIKLSYENNTWTVDDGDKSWTSAELIEEISEQPERFSPNVFLRPVLQNELLPDFAYIAGPGEISYYAQTKEFYSGFNQKMPVIMPRFSATLVESGIDRIFEKLPFEFADYNDRIEDLESKFIEKSDSPDIESIFDEWKKSIENVSEERVGEIKEVDPTLEGSSEKAIAAFFTELDKLKGKVYRSVKDQEKTQLNRIRKIKANLFPNANLQEREIASIYFLNKYGLDIWDELLEIFKNERPDSHKIIRL